MAYTRQSTGLPESKQLGVGPISIRSQLPAEIEATLLNGFLQLSSDQFTWASSITLPTLDTTKQLYIRYVKPAYGSTLTFELTIKNIGIDTFQNATLSAAGSDKVSLNGVDWSTSISLGTVGAGVSKTAYLQSATIAQVPVQAQLDVYDDSGVLLQFPFDVASGRLYCTINEVRDYLRTINVDMVSSDEELRDLIQRSAGEIDRATRRRFDLVRTSERYDGVGQQKLVLDNYPILAIHELKIFNFNNQLIRDIKETDSDFASNLITDSERGFITLPPNVVIMFPVPLAAMFYWPYSSYGAYTLRGTDYDYVNRFGRGVANIEVTYTYGYQVPPEGIRDTCMKMVVIELLKKKGASDTQGAAVISIAGMSESFSQRGGGQMGASGPFAQLISDLQADIDANLELFRKRRWGVV
jgi:hypothetical protein